MELQSSWGEEGLEEDDEELEDHDVESSGRVVTPGRAGSFLTKRGITLRVLMKDGLIEAGQGVLSIHYLGRKFQGDLLVDGKIRWQENGQAFNSPSAWATHCKKLVNPAKKSGCGWASVRYKGQKLDQYKTAWLRQNQSHGPAGEGSPPSEGEEDDLIDEEEEEESQDWKTSSMEPVGGKKQQSKIASSRSSLAEIRVPVKYSSLGCRDSARDPHTLVEVTSFAAINKFQPFHVSISSNALLLLDFHSHLTRSEVVGYLGGRWDTSSQLLTVIRAFPCRSRLKDTESAAAVEEEIYQCLFLRGLSLVGWYHSHPTTPAQPSLQDIDVQMDYQLKLQGTENSFQPCLGLICGPYLQGNQGIQSTICPFWVMPPAEHRPNDYGIPMEVEVTYIQDSFLTNEIVHEMFMLVDFYKGAPDLIPFQERWNEEITYLDKIKGSLSSRTPKDQGFSHLLDQVYLLLKQLG
ncbi:MPN domain-containing protein [Spea bombifrons]|uniref:MPN domain-containing protein n=1 Tax=Spea bombifrons TaxID=233779 RepID=UPI00234B21E4|nr:MPN domain-containing protein [Spea bombifrons]